MTLIVARPPSAAPPDEAVQRIQAAEDDLRKALAALLEANEDIAKRIRKAAQDGLSQRRIFELTGINRRRIQRILTTPEA